MAKAKANETWTVLPHGPIETLETNLWRVEGSLASMPLKRVMVIAARASGDLVIYNPMALDDRNMYTLDKLGNGNITDVIVPNGWHRLDAKVFSSRYPKARILSAKGSLDKVREVVPSAIALEDWAALNDKTITVGAVPGTNALEAEMIVKSDNGHTSLVVADAIFNMPHQSGMKGFVLKRITKSSGGPRISRIARMLMIKDKPAFAAHLDKMATPDLTRIVVGHHEVIAERPADTLRKLAESLR